MSSRLSRLAPLTGVIFAVGWVAVVLGVITVIPPATFPGLIGFVLWTLIVSVLVYLRTGPDAATPAAAPQSALADG